MPKFCKFCGKELKENYDLDEHEYYYDTCSCETAVEIQKHKNAIFDLKQQRKEIENNIWRHEAQIELLEDEYTKYI